MTAEDDDVTDFPEERTSASRSALKVSDKIIYFEIIRYENGIMISLNAEHSISVSRQGF